MVRFDFIFLNDSLIALNCNPSLATIEKLGGTKERNEKVVTIEEFLQIFSDLKKAKDQGCFEDFVECLKLYDKKEDGKMVLVELTYALTALGKCVIINRNTNRNKFLNRTIYPIKGEALTQEQVDTLYAECMGEENDDGEIEYTRKYSGASSHV